MSRIDKGLVQAASTIKTPLSFLALVILVTEGLLYYLSSNAEGGDFSVLVWAIALLPFAALAVFFLLFRGSMSTKVSKGHEAGINALNFAAEELEKSKNSQQTNIGGIKGTWKSTWYLEGDDDPYVSDHVWIEGIKENKVYGKGTDDKGTYEFEGFYVTGILTLVYKYIHTGYSLAGVIVLKIGPLAKTAHGKWYGFLKEGEINGGNVEWELLSENIIDKSDLETVE